MRGCKSRQSPSIATYQPLEGPETQNMCSWIIFANICIATYLPREGPETH